MTNPYAATAGQFVTAGASAAPHATTVWQLHTRIGRVRYLLYWIPYMFVGGVAAAGCLLIAPGLREHLPLFSSVVGGAVGCLLARRRLHDLDHSGWLAGLTLLPVISLFAHLWLLLAPGMPEPNRYGPPPSRNPRGAMAVLWTVLVIVTFAMMAAIIVPAVQAYNAKAAAAENPL